MSGHPLITIAERSLGDLAAAANREHAACEQAYGSALEHAFRAGEYLLAAKEEVAHGEWLPWVEENFDGSERTARGYMQLAREPDRQRVADSSLRGALQTLAKPRGSGESERMDVHYSSETPEWETPQELFDRLDAEFGFDLDVCASPGIEKCPQFFSPEQDGLSQAWTGACWMYPPYGQEIGRWVAKAWQSAREGATVVCLLPARVDTGWWWDYCRHGEVRFLRGRLRFGSAGAGAPFPSAVVIFGRPPAVKWWERGATW